MTRQYDTLGFIMPAMEKETFFDTLASFGVLPKKSFSLGEAKDKRYYLECRLIANLPKEEEQEEEEEPLQSAEPEEDEFERAEFVSTRRRGYRIRQEFADDELEVEELTDSEEE